MRNLLITGLLGLCFLGIDAQTNAVRLIEYVPAPGQHINIQQTGTPAAAEKMTTDKTSLVSLGGFGGYIILGFENPCLNDAANPYGIDFTIFGNTFAGASEPGIVWVMNDENLNGMPDDTWYEIAGSNYHSSKTVHDYRITYYKTSSRDVVWSDNMNGSGIIHANTYNLQEYYPSGALFPGYPVDSVSFEGTKIEVSINDTDPAYLSIAPPAFGYADNHPKKSGVNLFHPDNPYSPEVEGAGGDPFDISWAVDRDGNYVDLESVHFVKVATGCRMVLNHLGEISTDVSWITDVNPVPHLQGKEDLLVVYPFNTKIPVYSSVQTEAHFFKRGRLTESKINYSSSNPDVIQIDDSGKVTALKAGNVNLSIESGDEIQLIPVKAIAPEIIQIAASPGQIYVGDTVSLQVDVYGSGEKMSYLKPDIVNLTPELAEVIQMNGEVSGLKAIQPGEVELYFNLEDFDIDTTLKLQVFPSSAKSSVYMTIKTESENILPFQWIETNITPINPHVENLVKDYSSVTGLTLAHTIISGLIKSGSVFRFREDEAADGKLYLYSLENQDKFYYGWGGRIEPKAFARAWIARLNGTQYMKDFDQIKVNQGDTIVLYHIGNITEPWILSRLLSDKEAASEGDQLTFYYSRANCSFKNGQVLEMPFEPVDFFELTSDGSVYSGINGFAYSETDHSPPWLFSTGNDAVLIRQELSTGSQLLNGKLALVFPNPASDFLYLEGNAFDNAEVVILNASGSIIRQYHQVYSGNRINIASLPEGIYTLRVSGKALSQSMKFIKLK